MIAHMTLKLFPELATKYYNIIYNIKFDKQTEDIYYKFNNNRNFDKNKINNNNKNFKNKAKKFKIKVKNNKSKNLNKFRRIKHIKRKIINKHDKKHTYTDNIIIRNNNIIINKYILEINNLKTYKNMDIEEEIKKKEEKRNKINNAIGILNDETENWLENNAQKFNDRTEIKHLILFLNYLKSYIMPITDTLTGSKIDSKIFNRIMNIIAQDPNTNGTIDIKGNSISKERIEDKINEFIKIKETYKQKYICFRCGAIKHGNSSQCKHRCNKCFGNHDTNKCKIRTIICSWCGNQRGHLYDCITNDIRYLKSIQCPICGLFGHIGNNCNSLYLAISSLRTRNKLSTNWIRRRPRNSIWNRTRNRFKVIKRSRRR